MAKKIRFPLKMKNGAEVRTLDELRENFDLESVLGYFTDGKLKIWLADRYYDEKAEAISALSSDMHDLKAKLCEILEVEYQAEEDETDMELIARRREKLQILSSITDNREILDNVDIVAMSQDELFDILDESPEKMYLYGDKFSIPFGAKNIRYVGVNNPLLLLEKGKIVGNYNEADIFFENTRFEDGVDISAEKIYKEGYEFYRAEKYEEAFLLVKKSAEMGYIFAQVQLGILYENGTGTEKDYNKALEWYLNAADHDSPEAMYRLGQLYSIGKGIPQNYEKAIYYFTRSAEKGDEYACLELGEMYYYGLGVTGSDTEANAWYTKAFEKAIEEDNARVLYKVAEKYENGEGIAKDVSKAFKLYEKIAETGRTYAMNKLGEMCYNGVGTFRSNRKAVEWYTKAAEQGDARDKFKLGERFEKGWDVAQDFQQAMKWYNEAAESSDAWIKCCVGEKYEEGNGVPQNYQKALELYTEASEQGENMAKYKIYEMMYYGKGMPQDKEKALEMLRSAAQADDEDAQLIMMVMGLYW